MPVVKNPPANSGDSRDMSSNPGSGRSLGGENGNPLQYSCLENAMNRRDWWATIYGSESDMTAGMPNAYYMLFHNKAVKKKKS